MIRRAYFNRKNHNNCTLQEWSKRTGAKVLLVEYTKTKARVTYRSKPHVQA